MSNKKYIPDGLFYNEYFLAVLIVSYKNQEDWLTFYKTDDFGLLIFDLYFKKKKNKLEFFYFRFRPSGKVTFEAFYYSSAEKTEQNIWLTKSQLEELKLRSV